MAGSPDALPLLLVHDSTVSCKFWEAQMHALAEGCRLIDPDLTGHGALSDRSFLFWGAVELLREVVECESAGPLVVVGVSLGGHVTTLIAGRYPHKVSALVLSGASMNFGCALGWWVRLVGKIMLMFFAESRLVQRAEKNINAMAKTSAPTAKASCHLMMPRMHRYRS